MIAVSPRAVVPVILDKYNIKPQPMICASSEAESHKYRLYTQDSARSWLVADVPNAGDYIYSSGGKGFCGRVITFPLVGGGELQLKGPWLSNSKSLFERTGVDVRDKHLIWGCIGLSRENFNTINDVIYMDDEPVVGLFNRIELLAQEYADKLGVKVYFYSQSIGGSTSFWAEPSDA